MLHFDVNAGYGPLPEVCRALAAFSPRLGNPSSIHRRGQEARAIVEEARTLLGRALGLAPGASVVFTSGATEANNWAIFGPLLGRTGAPGGFVTSALEHPSVLATVPALAGWGVESRVVARSAAGSLDPERFAEACDEHTAVVSVMTANNETGEIFPIPAVVEAVRRRSPRALVHTDAVQAFGKVPLSLEELGVDCMSMSAHKIGGLPGVGALILRKGVVLPPLIRGGPQEGGLRAGTENVPGLYALIVALEALLAGGAARHAAMRERREVVHGVVSAGIPDARCNFRHTPQLPNTLSVTIPGVLADDLVVALDLAGVAVSSGAACGSGKPEPSHVLLASGFSAEEARATVRISLGWELSLDEVRRGAELLVQCVTRMRVAQGRG